MSESLTDIINASFPKNKDQDRKITVRGALERTFFIDGEIRRVINRVTNRAMRADMIGAVDPDDIMEGLNHLVTALNAINEAWDSFESAADTWGVTQEEIAEIVNAGGGRITEKPVIPESNKVTISTNSEAAYTRTQEQLMADDPKQIAPEDVPGFPHK